VGNKCPVAAQIKISREWNKNGPDSLRICVGGEPKNWFSQKFRFRNNESAAVVQTFLKHGSEVVHGVINNWKPTPPGTLNASRTFSGMPRSTTAPGGAQNVAKSSAVRKIR
jgi:hypothetical protein